MPGAGEGEKRLLTGLQPSGSLHLGNYYGVLQPFVETYENYESFLMVADYHALTSLKDKDQLHNNIIQVVKDYLAVGIDPEKVTIFQQSQVHEHTELAWILNCLVSVPFLMQAHSYKDKVARGLEANAGLFTYPMLMAADILLYDIDVVPVGEDQRQHLEYTREAAHKFNTTYQPLLKEPSEVILKKVGVVPGTDGQKMSKSYRNTIPLFADRETTQKAVMGIVTDSSGDVPENVRAIHELLCTEEALVDIYEKHKGKYKELKEILIEDIESLLAPMREKRATISDGDVADIITKGSERAREHAHNKMAEIRNAIGVAL